jgi:hypothetical protein
LPFGRLIPTIPRPSMIGREMTESEPTETGLNGTIAPEADTNVFVEATELLHGDAGDISATTVTIEQSTAGTVSGERVTVSQSALKRLDAGSAQLSQSAALVVKSADTALAESAAGVVSGGQITVVNSTVGVAQGPLTVANGTARILVQIGAAEGSVKPVLDGQSALRLGAGFGLSLVVFSRLLRRLLGR